VSHAKLRPMLERLVPEGSSLRPLAANVSGHQLDLGPFARCKALLFRAVRAKPLMLLLAVPAAMSVLAVGVALILRAHDSMTELPAMTTPPEPELEEGQPWEPVEAVGPTDAS
jgi:hypothetical protein